MTDYQSLLANQDSISRSLYPNRLQDSRRETSIPVPYTGRPVIERLDSDRPRQDTAAVSSVQESPRTMRVKRYIIVDSSQRDFVKQPNPYLDMIYTFGSQAQAASNPTVYTNNPFVPSFATDSNGNLNTVPGAPNTQGWYFSNVFYPPYNSSTLPGNAIGVDTGYLVQPSGYGFGSAFTACNVQAIRLIRAILPQRQFLNLPVVPGNPKFDIGGPIQTTLVGKPYSTFSTYPYLLLYLNTYKGQYVGGNEATRDAFSVMTQKTRTQTNFQIDVGVQHYDYEPWGSEALEMQSPITNLQQLKISVRDPLGVPFTQNDALSISLIQGDGAENLFLKCFTGSYQYFTSNELRVGDQVTFDTTTLLNILKSPILINQGKRSYITAIISNTFPVLELLDYVQDSNGIYQPRTTTASFVGSIASNSSNLTVTRVISGTLSNGSTFSGVTGIPDGTTIVSNVSSNLYELNSNSTAALNEVTMNATYSISARTSPYNTSYNGFLIPNLFSNKASGDVVALYSNVDSGPPYTALDPVQLVGSNLPFLNASLQPVFTFELTCLQPDTTTLNGGSIVL
jgi:hypothetical protein